MPNILAIIPARSGSKRLPGKNLKNLNGKPLIAWSIKQALSCKYFNEIIVSTDCANIASVAQSYDAKAPFLRPSHISSDDSPSSELIIHAINYYSDQGIFFDIVVLLEPTSPLRRSQDLNNAMELFLNSLDEADSLVSVGHIEREHPIYIKKIDKNNQLKSFFNARNCEGKKGIKPYFPYGVIYAAKIPEYLYFKTFYLDKIIPYEIERWQNFEVDDIVDFICVQKIMESYSAYL